MIISNVNSVKFSVPAFLFLPMVTPKFFRVFICPGWRRRKNLSYGNLLSLLVISPSCTCFNICGPPMTLSLYHPCWHLLVLQVNCLLAATSGVKDDLENCHRFFLSTLSWVSAELLTQISGTGIFFMQLAIFLDFTQEAKYKSLFL